MSVNERPAVEIWSPLPPQNSGIADYVHEQLAPLSESLDLTLVVEEPRKIDETIRRSYRVVSEDQADAAKLRVYHVGNSPLHGFIYREAVRVPGVVVLHEWNLHELLLGFAVKANDFDGYKSAMRREHGERGSVAAQTIASALGGRHWGALFPLNAELLGRALALVCLSGSTAGRAAARAPGLRVLRLDHHAHLVSHTTDRAQARSLLGLSADARVVVVPGLGTASKSLEMVEEAVASIQSRSKDVQLVTVGGGVGDESPPRAQGSLPRRLGRVDLPTLGDALVAADVVLALRFPSRGETSGVLMRALAAGRAAVVSSGSVADEDLPEGVVARVSPGPFEQEELTATLEFLLNDAPARLRLERLALAVAESRDVQRLGCRLAEFLVGICRERKILEEDLIRRQSRSEGVRSLFRDEVESAGRSLGLARIPANVYERLAGLS